MRIQGLIATSVLAVLILAGCTGVGPYAFLNEEMSGEDVVAADIAAETGLDPDTVRYQGESKGNLLFLALAPEGPVGGVQLVIIAREDSSQWFSAGSSGDNWFAMTGPSGFEAQYRPEGVGDPSDGWVALSEWVMVRG